MLLSIFYVMDVSSFPIILAMLSAIFPSLFMSVSLNMASYLRLLSVMSFVIGHVSVMIMLLGLSSDGKRQECKVQLMCCKEQQ